MGNADGWATQFAFRVHRARLLASKVAKLFQRKPKNVLLATTVASVLPKEILIGFCDLELERLCIYNRNFSCWDETAISHVNQLWTQLPRDVRNQIEAIHYVIFQLQPTFAINLKFGNNIRNIMLPLTDINEDPLVVPKICVLV